MAIEIKLPELGDGVDNADVLEVLVSEGESIEVDQGIIELETDKATAVVPSPHAGKVVKVHVAEGDTVPVDAVLLTIEAVGAKEPAAPAPAEPEVSQSPPEPVPEPPAPAAKPEPAATAPPTPTPVAAPQPVTSSAHSGGEIAAGPAVRRFAREVGVDLSLVTGTGEGGRISRDDILKVVRTGGRRAAAAASGDRDEFGLVKREKLSRMRRTIAEQMHRSWSTVPRVTNFDDADVTDLENIRQTSKADYAARGIKLTSMPFVIKAVAMALRDHPIINASIDMTAGQIIYKQYVNVGIAVDTDRGLVVPSLRKADDLSIPEIARKLGEIAEQVRNNKFTVEDLKGSSFTISNLGAIGGTYSTPIITVPETAILLIGRSRKMPVVIKEQIMPRLMMPLSISYDHRLIDGGAAARFLNDVIGFLEAPSRLLLAP
ncbi:MAG: 2-oxo acid dehydrogenase subunit E2 [Pirellulaceae bacterium]